MEPFVECDYQLLFDFIKANKKFQSLPSLSHEEKWLDYVLGTDFSDFLM